ncbi:MAG: pyruvate dehydrogenase complex dihydrolipoamide acetyltransferase [Gemmatimonadaceae bacterium]|nr:pyruvate dehydrogenase complex dihydrolipoamide acetyltransferase [Gemmatimonadaceae bacterium]
MATKIVMEALSPTMEEGRLVKWLKNEGDQIKSGEPLAEVETDKAVMEIVARGDGVLRKRLASEGQTVPVGSLIGVVGGADEDIGALVGASTGTDAGSGGEAAGGPPKEQSTGDASKSSKPSAAAASVAPPQAEKADTPPDDQPEGNAGEPDAAAQSDTPNAAREQAPKSVSTGNGAQSAPKLMGNAAPRYRPPSEPQPATEQPPHAETEGERPRSSPLARRLASEKGMDLHNVQGSGPAGRIIKRDIEAAATAQTTAAAGTAAVSAGQSEGQFDYEDIPLSPIRKTIARRLAESIGPIPTFYLTSEFDMERVGEMRSAMLELGDEFKVSVNDIVMKSVAIALSRHPEVNAHWLGDRIRVFSRVHLGMAVAIPEGLITPVIFDADRKRMSEISVEARELAKRARDRKLKPEEYTGSTFTVSNLGMFGIDQFTAIINPPEAGILAIGSVEEKPVVVSGEVVVRKRMRVTMSCDHRVIDGATGAKFLQTLRRLLENPLMMVY